MKFSCLKETIYMAVTTAAKAASAKSTIAVLEGLLLELNGSDLTITGYNLEIGISTKIRVNGIEDGKTVINARMISELIRKMPNGELSFEINDNCAFIRQGETELMTMVMSAADYIPIPQPSDDEEGFTLSQKTLKSMIMQTKYACATTDTKPVLTGCLFEIEDGILNVVSVDGMRIALRQEPINSGNIKFVVPPRTLDELIHLLSDEEDKQVTVIAERNQLSFMIGSYTMISRLLDGEFIDYKKHLAFNGEYTAEVKCRDIIDVLDRAMIFINEKNKAPIRCDFNGDTLSISCSTTLGKINDKINISYNGNPFAIGFNARFMLEAFRATDSDSVKIILSSSATAPILIVPMEGKEFTFFLLPMRLK